MYLCIWLSSLNFHILLSFLLCKLSYSVNKFLFFSERMYCFSSVAKSNLPHMKYCSWTINISFTLKIILSWLNIMTAAKEVLFSWVFVPIFVCLLAGLCKYCWLALPEIKSGDSFWSTVDPIKFLESSGSLSGQEKNLIFPFAYCYMPWQRYALSGCSC